MKNLLQLNRTLATVILLGVLSTFAVAQQPVLEFGDFKPVPKKWKNTFFKSGIMWNILEEKDGEILAYSNHDYKFEVIRFDHEFNINSNTLHKNIVPSSIFIHDNIEVFTVANGKIKCNILDYNSLSLLSQKPLCDIKMGGYNLHAVRVDYSSNKDYIGIVTREWKTLGDDNFIVRLFNRDGDLLGASHFFSFKHKAFKGIDYTTANDIMVEDEGKVLLTVSSYDKSVATDTVSQFKIIYVTKEGNREIDYGNLGYIVGNQKILSNSDGHLLMLLQERILYNQIKNLKWGGTMHVVDFDIENKTYRETATLSHHINAPAYVTRMEDGSFLVQGGREFLCFDINGNDRYFTWGEPVQIHKQNFLVATNWTENIQKLSFYKNGRFYALDLVENHKTFRKNNVYSLVLKSFDREGNYQEQSIEEDIVGNLYFFPRGEGEYLVWQQNVKVDGEYVQRLGTFKMKE